MVPAGDAPAARGSQRVLQAGAGALALLGLMVCGSLLLWVGLPLAWLWIGSQVQGATGNVGAAIGTMLFGFPASLALVLPLLAWLNRAYQRTRVARGLEDTGSFALEAVLVCSALVAVVGFVVWFVLFSGSSPIPIQISY